MSRARDLSKIGNKSTLAVDTDNIEVGIGSTVPSSTLDVRGEIKVGTAVQLGSAGVVTATSFSGSGANLTGLATTETVRADTLTVAGVSTFTGVSNFSAAINADATTDSTSVSTGALIVDGGVGIAKNVYIGAGLSVAGTLTYEDVTNVDSVGVVTAKSGVNVSGGQLLVGSGITMGIAGVATFSGTSDIHLHDSVRLNVGDASDLSIYHDGSNSFINDSGTGDLKILSSNFYVNNAADDENMIKAVSDGAVELYHNNVKTFETIGAGITIYGPEGGAGQICLSSDEGDDNADKWRITKEAGNNSFRIQNYTSGSWETNILATGDGAVELYNDNSKKFETFSSGVRLANNSALTMNSDSSHIYFGADDDMQITHNGTTGYINNTTGNFVIRVAGSEEAIACVANGEVDLHYDNSTRFVTTNEGVEVTGFTSTTAGMGVTGGLFEGAFIKAGKLSDNKTLGISTANVFYFTTQESTTATPNITWNDSYSLSSKMAVGDVASVTVITTAAAGGYSANWTIDGNAVTEEWVGGSAPSAGGSDGLDIYSLTIIKTGTGTGDSGFKIIGNLSNAT